MMVTSFLFLTFFGLELAMADDDPGPNCDVTVSSGESIQDFIDAADEGRLTEHADVKASWEARLAAAMD